MFDTDKFIEVIHALPALWDKSNSEYSNKDARQRAWVNVGESMYPKWSKFTYKERDNEIKLLKNKWRHVRDGFLRSLNKGKSGDAASSTKKKYAYADSLAFLLNTMEKRIKTTGNLEDSDDNHLVTNETDKRGGANDNEDGNSETVIENEPQSSTQNLPFRRKRKRQNSSIFTSFQSQLLKKLDKDVKQEEDGDKLFLLSLLPDYKKLNDDEKLDFKFMTLQFFRDIRRKNDSRNYSGNPSVSDNFNQSYPGSTRSQHILIPMYPQTLLNDQNPTSPNDSQLSPETLNNLSQSYPGSSRLPSQSGTYKFTLSGTYKLEA